MTWPVRAALWVVAWTMLWGACLATQAHAKTMVLQEAMADVYVDGKLSHVQATLPYHWDKLHSGQQGQGVFYFNFPFEAVVGETYALYATKLGNAYAISLNGELLQHKGDMETFGGSDYAKVPRLLSIPQGLLRNVNTLEIRIRADRGRRSGLSPLLLGRDADLQPEYASRYRWRGTGTLVVVTFSLLVAVFAFAVWTTQVRVQLADQPLRNRVYLLAAAAEIFWTIRVGDAIVENPLLAWPAWGVVNVVAIFAWSYAMAFFCLEVAQWSHRPLAVLLRRWLAMLCVLSVPLSWAALEVGQAQLLTAAYAALLLTFVVFVPIFAYRAYASQQSAPRLVALAVLVNVVVGIYDLYELRISGNFASNSYMRYSSALFGMALMYVVIRRFREAADQSQKLAATLVQRVEQKERELSLSYQRLEGMAREQERIAERTRLLRDFHDGVGSHISVAIRQLDTDNFNKSEVLQTMHESLDLLKLFIDTLHLPPGDMTALLANMRYRLEPRLKASGIALVWQVDLLPVLAQLDEKAMRHIQLILYGALSNVLQHAKASVLRIEATLQHDAVHLCFVDDGIGFDTAAPLRKGLESMRERAQILGARLFFRSQPGETTVELLIPLAVG